MSIGRSIAATFLAALGMAALPAAAQLCGQACSGTGILQFTAPEQGQFGFARSRSMAAPPHLLQVQKESSANRLNEAIRVMINSPQEGGTGEDYNITFGLPNNAPATPGTYNATRYPFHPDDEAGFSFSGTGAACNTSTATFTIHEVVLGTGTAVESLALDFTHGCGTSGPYTTGALRFNSSYPIGGGGGGGGGGGVTNLSTRGVTMGGEDVLIGGFTIGGPGNKTVMLRARGPSLGVPNSVLNPAMTLYRSSDNAIITTNDDWEDAYNSLSMEYTGFQPPHPNESGMLISLAPGGYTAVITGVGGSEGIALFEIFELAQPDVPLLNISTRGRVESGDNVLIGGFIVDGSPQAVILRARGPSLAAHGIASPLANPTIQLVRSSDGVTLATNDDWGTASNAAAIGSSGFAPSDPLESAILMTLDPGAYTVIVSGVGGAAGIAIAEVFAN